MMKYGYAALITLSLLIFTGWGGAGHTMINSNTTRFFPQDMSQFTVWKDYLAAHASDADNRKNTDASEDKKHYINIEEYTEFISSGKIPENLNTAIRIYGAGKVESIGILPWATITTVDSLKNAFARKDWGKAEYFAADLGHYVGDGHMPLHVTINYDGKNGTHTGLHSRYDGIASRFPSGIVISSDSIQYVNDVSRYVFDYIYGNYRYVDSVFYADSVGLARSSNQITSTYYNGFWDKGRNFTNMLFNNAAKRLASLIYTAWVDAGKPQLITSSVEAGSTLLNSFRLLQNYPNPFNPETVINYELPAPGYVRLSVYDLLGREIAVLADGSRSAGEYSIKLNAADFGLRSGIYFYRLQSGKYSVTRKMVVLQ